MLYLEESVETILSEEGQDLLGLSFLTDTLGLTMKKMEALFRKSALQYSRRRPVEETRVFNSSSGDNVATLVMPEGVHSIKAVRYGVLEELPRFYMEDFGKIAFEYEEHTRVLKVWPPITPLRITYTRDLAIEKTRKVVGTSSIPADDTYFYTELPTSPIKESLVIKVGDLEIKVTDEYKETIPTMIGEEEQVIYELTATGVEGTYNTSTRELELNFNSNIITEDSIITYEYYPLYCVLPDISLRDEIFNKLFASKILEALATLRAQATQEVLHNIDLTTDELYTRVRILKRELNTLLKETIKFSGMAPI